MDNLYNKTGVCSSNLQRPTIFPTHTGFSQILNTKHKIRNQLQTFLASETEV